MKHTFYNENHLRDKYNRIVKRDFSTHEGVQCDNCKCEIIGKSGFQVRKDTLTNHDKDIAIIGVLIGAKINPMDIDYCHNCVAKFNNVINRMNNGKQ